MRGSSESGGFSGCYPGAQDADSALLGLRSWFRALSSSNPPHCVPQKKKKIIHPASRVRCVEIHTLLDTVSLATFSAGTVAFSCTEDITVDPCDSGSHTHIASHSLGSDSNTRVDMMIFSRILARAAVFDIPAIRSISRQEQIASHTGRWCTYSWL